MSEKLNNREELGEEPQKDFFITRHSKKPKGEDLESPRYPGVSEKGVELVDERARELAEMVEESQPGSVVFISGGTELIRTKSTAEAYGDKLEDLMKGNDNVVVMTRSSIKEGSKGKGYSASVKEIVAQIEANPDKKIVIDFPLAIKDMSPVIGGFFDKSGKLTPWANELLARNNGDEYAAFRDWVETKGDNGKGPNPEDTAKRYEKGLERLREFAKDKVGERPLVVGTVGHSWDIDVFLTYMATGKVDLESFDKISGGGIIKETEVAKIVIQGENTTVGYRDKKFDTRSEK